MEDELKKEKNHPRKKIAALLLSILVPGLGQLYNGQPKKFLIYAIGLLTLLISFNLLELKQYFWIYASLLVLLILVIVAIAIESILVAHRTKEFQLRKYNKWYVYLTIVLVWVITSSTIESFFQNNRFIIVKVNSDYGNPTILSNDFLLIDYGYYTSKQPEYGDLIVLLNPNGEKNLYRIIGMPNDTLNLENQLVKFATKKSTDTFVSTFTHEGYETEEFLETLPNGSKYPIYRNKTPFSAGLATIKDIIVPDDFYYLLGDNRDFAADSRLIGFVSRQQIKGRVLAIYYSKDLSRINKRLAE
ncbi:MAG: signal peptidase I [Bacteroidales bacterium]|nr:signal peptidase I [Bacteroidales bacterium]